MLPAQQRRKTRKIRIRAYPLASAFDSLRGVGGIRHESAHAVFHLRTGVEKSPMIRTRTNEGTAGPVDQRIQKPKGLRGGGRRIENTWIRHHSDETA